MERIRTYASTIALVLVMNQISISRTHVSLTYPPARKYDLDFLDSSRTKAPCGMPRGNARTTILSGSKFNVTWHLGYPHKGGFRIQMLDELERPVLDLTPATQESQFISNDATAQSFQINLPTDYTCTNCTLRLIRQALEWGSSYKFWSCADINIKNRKEFRETCSGHGRYLLGRCKCDRLYYGDKCQYRDECWENSDCGDHGTCVNVEATTAPRQQCYCHLGWFGPGCNKKSPVKTTDIDLSIYSTKRFSDNFMFYWRIIKEHNEIEVVLKINGTSYAALGWRPRSLTKSCKNFPKIEEPQRIQTPVKVKNSSVNETVPKSEPQPEPNPSTPRYGNKSKFVLKRNSKFLRNGAETTTATAEPTSEPETTSVAEPTSEPEPSSAKGTGKATPRAEPEPEPTSEPEPNGTSEPEPEPTSEPEPEGTAEPKSASEPEPTKAEPTAKTEPEMGPYTPRFDFSPMDCTDIIIGSARNTSSRIADYYTRDRSTPRMDSFWGGRNDLTAAMGFEIDGVTTILFRKKLAATEPSDHSIEDSLMHVIFAQGQDRGKYVHSPKSGLETGQALVKDFYKPDELKYHGHGSKRGALIMNFFDEAKLAGTNDAGAEDESANLIRKAPTHCGSEWKIPKNCDPLNYTCEYSVKWEYMARTDDILFTITTSHTDSWTGIGFSNDEKMSQTDAILGWVDKTGRPFLMDTWITGYTQPLLDSSQGIFNATGRIVNGVTLLSFARKRISDDPKDLSFTNSDCLYMMYPIKGGAFNSVNKKIRKHELVPVISSERICIKACGEIDFMMASTASPTTGYNVKVKLLKLGENFAVPLKGTIQYEEFANTINDNFRGVLNRWPGYREFVVDDIKVDQDNNIITTMNLQIDADVDKGRSLTKQSTEDGLKKLLLQNVNSGQIGALKVDPQYLVFEPLSLTSNAIADESTESGGFFDLSMTKLFMVIGCIAALLLVAVIQAVCTIYRASYNTSQKHKDHLVPNSSWKDYSAENTNHAFEPYDEKHLMKSAPHPTNNTLPPKTTSDNTGRSAKPQKPPQYQYAQPPSGGYIGDTRSLQKVRSDAYGMDRSTFSLPRTAYDRHMRSGPAAMQPDFYFMPSQRKYSGEVVRVYVDYSTFQHGK